MAPPSGEHLQLRTLGAHALLRGDGSALALQRRPFALLAFVAASTRGASREKTLGVLWADTDEERARHAMAQAVYALRRACGGDVIVGTATLCIDPALVEADVGALARALAANDADGVAALYHGPFLDGFHLGNADEFERWMDAERERLRVAVGRVYQRAAAAAGEPHAAAEWWRRAATLDPLDTRIALALAESLAASGDATAAVKHAELHQALRRAELDLPPEPALAALVERLRAHRPIPSRSAPDASSPTEPPRTGPDPAIPPRSSATIEAPPIEPPAAAPRRRSVHARWIVGGVLAAVAIVAAGAVVLTRQVRPLSDQRVVVAPFEDETGDTTLAPLGDMAADWVAGELARTGLVQVVDSRMALGSVQRGARTGDGNAAARAREFARSVGAGIVVWGEYYRRGDSIEVHSEITDVRDGMLLRDVPPIAAPARDPIVAVQQLTGRVMGALATLEDPRLGDWANRRGVPPSYAAYREFIEGLSANGRLEFTTALVHYRRAVALDTTFVDPDLFALRIYEQIGAPATADSLIQHVERASDRLTPFNRLLIQFLDADLNGDPERAYQVAHEADREIRTSESELMVAEAADRVERPREATSRFAHLDPTSGWMHGWSYVCREMVDAAHVAGENDVALRFATAARRNYPDALVPYYCAAEARVGTGDVPGALAEVDSAATVATEPIWQLDEVLYRIGSELYVHGHVAEARRLWERQVAWDDAQPASARGVRSRDHEIRALAALGRSREALAQARALAVATPADPAAEGTLGVAELASGDTSAARAVADRLARRLAASRHAWDRGPIARAASRLAAAFGDDTAAVTFLREALKDGAVSLFDVHRSAAYDTIRRRPDFVAVTTPRG